MAHINELELLSELTLAQKEHVNQCELCQESQQLLEQLTAGSKQIEIEMPPAQVWQKIKVSRTTQPFRKKFRWQMMAGNAAVLIIAIFGWLSWNNYQLQERFQEVLVMNQILERQLIEERAMHYTEAYLFEELGKIEIKLHQTDDLGEKVNVLLSRQKQIKRIIHLQKGNQNEHYL